MATNKTNIATNTTNIATNTQAITSLGTRVDGLTNNAGIGHMESLTDLSEELLDEMWSVNVRGPLRLIQRALPLLAVSGEGRIVNVVSSPGRG